MSNKNWKLILAIYTLGIFTILYLAYSGGIPKWIASVPHYDLVGHFVLYGIWSFLVYQAFSRRFLGPIILTILTIGEELLQMLSINRTFSLLDLFFSVLGIWLAIYLANTIYKS